MFTILKNITHLSIVEILKGLGACYLVELEVTPRNRLCNSEDFDIVVTHITKVSFSQNGMWMATIDKKLLWLCSRTANLGRNIKNK